MLFAHLMPLYLTAALALPVSVPSDTYTDVVNAKIGHGLVVA